MSPSTATATSITPDPAQQPATRQVAIATLYPSDMVVALLDVKHWHPEQRNTPINTLTAELCRRGLVRDPADDSRADTWAALRHTPTPTPTFSAQVEA